jgi:hypothetical protein
VDDLVTLGLWGDGDEYHAIQDAFGAISIRVPVEDASTWIKVGDLWASVKRVDPEIAASPERWETFRRALAEESCVEWSRIGPATTLLDGKGHSILARLWTSIRERFASHA